MFGSSLLGSPGAAMMPAAVSSPAAAAAATVGSVAASPLHRAESHNDTQSEAHSSQVEAGAASYLYRPTPSVMPHRSTGSSLDVSLPLLADSSPHRINQTGTNEFDIMKRREEHHHMDDDLYGESVGHCAQPSRHISSLTKEEQAAYCSMYQAAPSLRSEPSNDPRHLNEVMRWCWYLLHMHPNLEFDRYQRLVFDQFACSICLNTRIICPGCTNDRLQKEYPQILLRSCGFMMRCPKCVSVDGAVRDAAIIMRYSADAIEGDIRISQMYIDADTEIRHKYPGWSRNATLVRMR